jgi:hypothetical protein
MGEGLRKEQGIAEFVADVSFERIHVRAEIRMRQTRGRRFRFHRSMQPAQQQFGIGLGAVKIAHKGLHGLDRG